MKERPGAQTPWMGINQLLAPDECFEVLLPHWQGFLLAPKYASQLAALLYVLRQEGVFACIQGRGTQVVPLKKHAVIVSTRAFSQIAWYEQGIVEVGAGCSLSHLQQFLFERNQEVTLEEGPFDSPKRSVVGLFLSGQLSGMRYKGESFLSSFLGIEFVTGEGSQVRWGGHYGSAVAGPTLHQLINGLQNFSGVIVKVILKTFPISPARLRLAWKFRHQEELWQKFHDLSHFSSSWEYLDVVLSGKISEHGFIFARVSGLPGEMHAFAKVCPHYMSATQQGERTNIRNFFLQQKLKSYSVTRDQPLEEGEYLWIQDWNDKIWWLTEKKIANPDSSSPIWKQRFLKNLYE